MPIRIIFLVGAPLPGSLDWNNDKLLDKPIPPFQDSHDYPSSDCNAVKWRVLQPLPSTKVNDQHGFYFGPEDPGFVTTHQLLRADTTSIPEDSILSQFYSHSFQVHETSEIGWDEDSTQTTGEASTASLPQETCRPKVRISVPLRDLQDIPTAEHFRDIAPRTMTVNLMVGIIAVHETRRIVTRQKKELDIVEVVVGDETRTGFGINFWLTPEKSDRLSESLARLRPQEIVLLRTVGLASFGDRVYGQSLRGMTQVELVDTTDAGGIYFPREKLRRVREWVLQFVGTDGVGVVSGMLPPDTQ